MKLLPLFLTGFTLSSFVYSSEITGANTNTFTSPNGVIENCVIIDEIASGEYSKKDEKKANSFCDMDFYNNSNLGLCAKTWSTSPGTIVYKLEGSSYENQKEKFEAEVCGTRKTRDFKSLAKFKNSMNQEGTSGTYAASNLLYFHFSKFFNTKVEIPVSVYREIDKDEHLKRAKVGVSSSPAGMIRNGWKWTIEAINNPKAYWPTSDLFTNDREKIYGIMLKDSGERYGAEINGIRSSWGQPSSEDFLNTPAFIALANSRPLNIAIEDTLSNYKGNLNGEIKKHKGGLFKKKNQEALNNLSYMSKVLPKISKEQVAFWMNDLVEITILDTIFNQQDRIGNIDFRWFAVAVNEDGKIEDQKLDSEESLLKIDSLTTELTGKKVKFIQRSYLNDNDAGVREAFVNFTKKVDAVSKIAHISEELYEKIKTLNNDLSTEGEIFQYLKNSFGLKSSEIDLIVDNTNFVFKALKSSCLAKKLKFDLYPNEYFSQNKVVERIASCN